MEPVSRATGDWPRLSIRIVRAEVLLSDRISSFVSTFFHSGGALPLVGAPRYLPRSGLSRAAASDTARKSQPSWHDHQRPIFVMPSSKSRDVLGPPAACLDRKKFTVGVKTGMQRALLQRLPNDEQLEFAIAPVPDGDFRELRTGRHPTHAISSWLSRVPTKSDRRNSIVGIDKPEIPKVRALVKIRNAG